MKSGCENQAETAYDVIREARGDYFFALRDCGEKMGRYLNRIEAAVRRLEADRDNWRSQALSENARAEAVIGKMETPPVEWCRECEANDGNVKCPFWGEPDGCNNRDARSRLQESRECGSGEDKPEKE